MTQRLPGQPALNRAEAISIRDLIDAYTISGAKYLKWDNAAGSIETGKSADLMVLDQDIPPLAAGAMPKPLPNPRS